MLSVPTHPTESFILGKASDSQYVTQCKLCEWAVYKRHDRIWLNSPLGISHATCAREKGLAP
jgi:hypothetical protein